MKKREIKDSGASIRARLTNIAKETKRDFDAILLQYFQAFDMHLLHKAIVKTFNRRGTPIEDRKSIFKKEFKSSKEKQTQWIAFLRRSHLESYKSFAKAIDQLELFLEHVCSRESLSSGDQVTWSPEKWRWQ